MTSLPRSLRTSSTHLVVFRKLARSARWRRSERARGPRSAPRSMRRDGKAASAHWRCRTRRRRRSSRGCTTESGCGSAPVVVVEGRAVRARSRQHLRSDHRHPRGTKRRATHLSGGVPELQADGTVLEVHRLGQEVDADGRLVARVKGVVHLFHARDAPSPRSASASAPGEAGERPTHEAGDEGGLQRGGSSVSCCDDGK